MTQPLRNSRAIQDAWSRRRVGIPGPSLFIDIVIVEPLILYSEGDTRAHPSPTRSYMHTGPQCIYKMQEAKECLKRILFTTVNNVVSTESRKVDNGFIFETWHEKNIISDNLLPG